LRVPANQPLRVVEKMWARTRNASRGDCSPIGNLPRTMQLAGRFVF
jgi:hypothetical protein